MPHPSLRRLASGLAIAATASAVLVAPTAQAQSPGQTVAGKAATTSISIRISKPRIKPGAQARITGHLAVAGDASPAGRTVTLEAKPRGTTGFVPVAEVVTASRGSVSAVVEPGVTTRYRWRYLGDVDARASRSGVATLRVRTAGHHPRRLATSLSIRKVFRVSAEGGIDIVRGRLRAGRVGLPHRPVILLSKASGSKDWTYEGTRSTRRLGTFKFRVDPSAEHGVPHGLPRLESSSSRPQRRRASASPSRRVDLVTPSSITRGESVTITGLVTDLGTPVAGAKVVLWVSKVGHPATARRVKPAGITAEDGTVVFTDTPRKSKKYRLRVVRGEGTKVALSGAVRVIVTPTSA